MRIKITGKNLDVGTALRERASARVEEVLAKHFDRGFEAHVVFERTRLGFYAECVVHLDSGVRLHSRAEAANAHAALDQAVDRLEKRLRRHRRRLKDHHAARVEHIPSLVLEAPGNAEDEAASGDGAEDNPVIVAESSAPLPTLPVGEAVMRLDLDEHDFFVFRNAAHGAINVVYRRQDGNIGWLDPARETAARQSA